MHAVLPPYFSALFRNKFLILGFLLLLPSYYFSRSTLSWPWLSLFFFSLIIPTSYLCTGSSYWEVWWHLSTLRHSIFSSAFPRAFFFRDFLPEFVVLFCCRTSLVYAQPALKFERACTLPSQCLYTVRAVLYCTVFSRSHFLILVQIF